jgi:hypothetical protein
MRPRFSLRTQLVLTAIVAAGCYWFVLPTIMAQRFARAVDAENYTLADSYFRDTDDQFLHGWNEKHWRFHAQASLNPWSWRELARGERSVNLGVAYGDAGPMRSANWIVIMIWCGLLKPEPTLSGGHGGGGIL